MTDDSGYYDSYGEGTPYYSGGYPSPTAPTLGPQSGSPPAADNSAHVTLSVPAGARVSFGGTPTTSTGPVREYISPALTPGKQYTYEIQARWSDNGQDVTQTQQVGVSAGAHVNVTFPSPRFRLFKTAARSVVSWWLAVVAPWPVRVLT
jgi:uncharacterized protein (TIGR03000 family)